MASTRMIGLFALAFSMIACITAARIKISAMKSDLVRDNRDDDGLKSPDAFPTPLTAEQRQKNRGTIRFFMDMIKMKGQSYTKTFCSRDPSGQCSTVDGFPGPFSHSELKYSKVAEELEKIPMKEVNGEIRRLGDLGYLIFNDLLWEDDWKTFPIGADLEDHAKHRPTADLLMGSTSPAWDRKMIAAAVANFFRGRRSMNTADYGLFVTKLFHKILLDMDLSDMEVLDFEKYKEQSMMVALPPRWVVWNMTPILPKLSDVKEQRNLWLEKYVKAIEDDTRGFMPKLTEARDKRFLADLLLTSMTSAGGLSVPTVLNLVLGIVYGGDKSPWKVEQRVLTKKNIEPLVLETIRRYPAVVGFPSWSPDIEERYVLNIAVALRDPDVWENAEDFVLRDLKEYHAPVGSGTKIGLAWAQQAKGPELTKNSRGCPGQDFSMAIVTEFLKFLMPMQQEWTVSEQPKNGIEITEGPCAASAFTLTRGGNENEVILVEEEEKHASSDIGENVADMAKQMFHSSYLSKASDPQFRCPAECQECCMQEKEGWFNGLLGNYSLVKKFNNVVGRRNVEQFLCVMSKEAVSGFHIVGRSCTEATVRKSNASQGSALCDFSLAEKALKVGENTPWCTYSPIVQPYDAWLVDGYSGDPCSVSKTGTFTGIHLIGGVIDKQFFSVRDTVTGGVCGSKFKDLKAAGFIKQLCPSSALGFEECEAGEKERLCNMLQEDLDVGRLDDVALAMWAGAVGALATSGDFAKPMGRRQLKKFQIPGWKTRKVAWETLPYDKQIHLQGGGYQCMMTKFASKPVYDDVDGDRNLYLEPGSRVDDSSYPPQNSVNVNTNYYDRYSVYQKPQHFVVPPDQLQLDETLSKLVFQSIGAHRLEPIINSRTVNLSPIGIDGRMAVPASDLFSKIPSHVQEKAAFIVRLEGLFEQVTLRDDMQRWGGNAFFSKEGEILAIQYGGETQVNGEDPDRWNVLKFIFRSSLVSTVTTFDHLVSTHILAANSLAIAAVEALPHNHGLRHIITPHIWGTMAINIGAATNLFAPGMLVHRASPFDAVAFQEPNGDDGQLWKMIPALRYTKFQDLYSNYIHMKTEFVASDGKIPFVEIPFFEDGKILYDALNNYVASAVKAMYGESDACSSALQRDEPVLKFVTNFFDQNEHEKDFYPEEFRRAGEDCNVLVSFVTEVIFLVTGWHRHVGTVADFFRDTRFASTAWKKGEVQSPPKHSMMTQLLAATTNANYPKLTQSLSDIYSRDVQFKDIFDGLHTSMMKVQQEVEERNEWREKSGRLGFHQMEPAHIEWGVEV